MKEVPVEVIKEVEKIKLVEVIREVDMGTKHKIETSRSNKEIRREIVETEFETQEAEEITETLNIVQPTDNLKVVEGIGS